MTAIETKFIPPTNHRPARIKAFTRTGKPSRSITISYHSTEGNAHLAAANALIDKLNWRQEGYTWVHGNTESGTIHICCVNK